MLLSQKYPVQLQSLMPLHQTNEPLSDAIPWFNSAGEGKQKTNLKFRQNGITKSQDNQNLLIHTLQSLPKISCFPQTLSINHAIFQEVCAHRKGCRISVQAMPLGSPQTTFIGLPPHATRACARDQRGVFLSDDSEKDFCSCLGYQRSDISSF